MQWGSIYLINYKWAYATFSDGHIAGYGIFEFNISDNKEITWELIDGRLYGE